MIPNGKLVEIAAMPSRRRLDHRGPLSKDITSAWYFITICASERDRYGRVAVPSATADGVADGGGTPSLPGVADGGGTPSLPNAATAA